MENRATANDNPILVVGLFLLNKEATVVKASGAAVLYHPDPPSAPKGLFL